MASDYNKYVKVRFIFSLVCMFRKIKPHISTTNSDKYSTCFQILINLGKYSYSYAIRSLVLAEGRKRPTYNQRP